MFSLPREWYDQWREEGDLCDENVRALTWFTGTPPTVLSPDGTSPIIGSTSTPR